jgi:hypothetical protein
MEDIVPQIVFQLTTLLKQLEYAQSNLCSEK